MDSSFPGGAPDASQTFNFPQPVHGSYPFLAVIMPDDAFGLKCDIANLLSEVHRIGAGLDVIRQKEDRLAALEKKLSNLGEEVRSDLQQLQEWVQNTQTWVNDTDKALRYEEKQNQLETLFTKLGNETGGEKSE